MNMPHQSTRPSAWVTRFAPMIADGGRVLDVACGAGRHTRRLLAAGCRVTAVDIDLSGVADLGEAPGATLVAADLETAPWPFAGVTFDAVVVTNYLHRPIMRHILDAVGPSGLLIYETFAAGNEAFGRPRNPDFLLARSELLELVQGRMTVLAYEDVVLEEPQPAAIQRICARA